MAKVVLVHGAWHGAWCWEGVVDALEAKGVDVDAVELPLTSHAARHRRGAQSDRGRRAGRRRVRPLLRWSRDLERRERTAGRAPRLPRGLHDRHRRGCDRPHAGLSIAAVDRDAYGHGHVDDRRVAPARVLLRGQRREASRGDRAPAAPDAAWRRLGDAGRAGVAAGAVDVRAVHERQSDRSRAPSERWRCTPTR